MQYVECKFPNSPKSYCYRWEGDPPLTIGEKVDVVTDRGELSVEVVGVREVAPTFATKAILRRVTPGVAAETTESDW